MLELEYEDKAEGVKSSFNGGKFVLLLKVLRPRDEVGSSTGNDTISSKWFWFVLNVTDLGVLLGLAEVEMVDVEIPVRDSVVLFFLGIAPVFLLGADCLSKLMFVEDSNCKLVTVEEDVEPDEITTAVVDIFEGLFP